MDKAKDLLEMNQDKSSAPKTSGNCSERQAGEAEKLGGDAQAGRAIGKARDLATSRIRQTNAARSDKGRTHFSRDGLLSRDVLRALIRLGESLKNLKRWGPLLELLFAFTPNRETHGTRDRR